MVPFRRWLKKWSKTHGLDGFESNFFGKEVCSLGQYVSSYLNMGSHRGGGGCWNWHWPRAVSRSIPELHVVPTLDAILEILWICQAFGYSPHLVLFFPLQIDYIYIIYIIIFIYFLLVIFMCVTFVSFQNPVIFPMVNAIFILTLFF